MGREKCREGSLDYSGQPALRSPLFIVAGHGANAWVKFGFWRPHITERSVVRDVTLAFRFQKAGNAARSRLTRERDSVALLRDDLRALICDRLGRCARDQQSEFPHRQRA